MKKLLPFILVTLFFLPEAIQAQVATDSVCIYYKQGHREIDTDYKDNQVQLARFLQVVRDAHQKDIIDQLIINSYSSPDGISLYNKRLSGYRAECVSQYLIQHTGVPERLIKKQANGIAWKQLRDLVAVSEVPYRNEVLHIIDHTPEWIYDASHRIVDGKKKQLMDLHYGIPYRYMYEHLFPQLRSSVAVSLYLHTTDNRETVAGNTGIPTGTQPADSLSAAAGETATIQDVPSKEEEPVQPEAESPMRWGEEEAVQRLAIKTNLLYDAILMPSLEVEYRINDRWSVNLEGDMAWWKNDGKHKYYQLATISPEGRYWFKTRKPWHGHYIGLFGGFTWYDLENGKRGYKGEAEMAGLSYGYMWPIGKRISLETGVGVGFLHTRYEEYLPLEGHYVYQQTKQTNYFGPLKLKLALVWRLWNEKKKGEIQ